MKDFGKTHMGEHIVIMKSEEREALLGLQSALCNTQIGPGMGLNTDMDDALNAIERWASMQFKVDSMQVHLNKLREAMEGTGGG